MTTEADAAPDKAHAQLTCSPTVFHGLDDFNILPNEQWSDGHFSVQSPLNTAVI